MSHLGKEKDLATGRKTCLFTVVIVNRNLGSCTQEIPSMKVMLLKTQISFRSFCFAFFGKPLLGFLLLWLISTHRIQRVLFRGKV